MGTEENKAIIRRFIDEVFNEGKLAAIPELVDSGYIMHGPGPAVSGQQGMQKFVTTYRTALPDYHCTVEDQVAEGDKVVTRWTVRGTQRGTLDGLPPTREAGNSRRHRHRPYRQRQDGRNLGAGRRAGDDAAAWADPRLA